MLDATQDDATTATFVMQCHWQDDDHVLRESGAMFYRVLRTPFKSAKKGIKLVNSPWEGAAPTKYSLRVGERFRVNERVTDTNGMVSEKGGHRDIDIARAATMNSKTIATATNTTTARPPTHPPMTH